MAETPACPIPHAYWVEPGRLLAGQYPGAYSLAETQARLAAFLAAGVTLFLDLSEAGDGLEPYAPVLLTQAAASGRTAEHLRMPVRDLSTPTPASMIQILNAIDRALAAGQVVYVHCWGGVGRTGTVIGCYLARHGHAGEAALAELAALRRGWPDGRQSPETEAQRRMVRTWPAGA